jgi:capsular polysaccharide biosynthesis protein
MTAPFNILKIDEKYETGLVRVHYEEVARDTLRVLWDRKLLIAAIVMVAFFVAAASLLLIGPRYSAEAIIQLNFIREEPTVGTKTQPIATLDPVALVDSAARAIRSRATASAVVARLKLDKDPEFARESVSWRVLSTVQAALGLKAVPAPPRDLAATQIMQRITVTNDPRSYSISVSITTGDPERAMILANAVALEYLRGQILQELANAHAAAERELAQLSSVYGAHHPNSVLGRARLANLHFRLAALRDGSPPEDAAKLALGQLFLPAEINRVPSGPNIPLVLGLAIGGALAVAIWLALGFTELIDKLVDASASYLIRQLQAGADAVQIFYTWAGVLPAEEFYRWCVSPTQRIIAQVRAHIPGAKVIGFPRGVGAALLRYIEDLLRRAQPSGCTASKTVASKSPSQHAIGFGNKVDTDSDAALQREEVDTVHSRAGGLACVVATKPKESRRAYRGNTNRTSK